MDYLKSFLEWLEIEGKDIKTIKAYRTSVNQFLEWYRFSQENNDVREIKPIVVKEFLGYLKHTLHRKHATINKSAASLKTFFLYLAENTYIDDNPMIRIKIQKVETSNKIGEKNVTKWLSKAEQERFINYVELEKNDFKRLRNLAIIDLMLYVGLRLAEVEELKLNDIVTNSDITITVREGKRGKYSSVTLVSKYTKNLKKWIKYRNSLGNEMYCDSPYLFVSERSEKLSSRGIQVMIEKYGKLANMNDVTPHRLRHSFCKNLANAGVNIEIIRRLARHESIQTTAIYIDPSYEEQVKALEKL